MTSLAVLTLAVGLLVSAGAGCASGSRLSQNGSALSRFRGVGVSFRYPSAWTRAKGCGGDTMSFDVVVLTTGKKAPVCHVQSPPTQALDRNGASVWWVEWGDPGPSWFSQHRATERLGGQPAHSWTIRPTNSSAWQHGGCAYVGGDVALSTLIQAPGTTDNYYTMWACLRGPEFAGNRRAVRQMLASVRFVP
jgi:hypothetical protein